MHISKNLSVDKGTNKIVIKNDIVTCEDIISVQFYQFVATLYTTNFYSMKRVNHMGESTLTHFAHV